MRKLLAYLKKNWADFDDEFSFSFKKDRVIASISTSRARFLFYLTVASVSIYFALSLCEGGVGLRQYE